MTDRRGRAALVAAIVAGFGLRIWKIDWGLADEMAFPDELLLWKIPFTAFIPFELESFLMTPLLYPPLYNYVVGVLAALAHGLGWITGDIDTAIFDILLIARMLSACFGVGTVVAVYAIGKRFYSPSTGVLAAAFVAVTPISVLQPHYASVDVLLELTISLTLLATCRLQAAPNRVHALLAGCAAGLAFSSKYTGLQSVLLPAATIAVIGYRQRQPRQALSLIGYTAVGFAVTAALTCPPCLVRSWLMFHQMSKHALLASNDAAVFFRNNQIQPTLGWYAKPYVFQLVAVLPFVLGWPLYGLTLFGIGRALARRSPVDAILLFHIATYFAAISGSVISFPRYLIPILPAAALLAARALTVTPPTATRTALVAVALAYTMLVSATQVNRFSWDQQEAVADWVSSLSSAHPRRKKVPVVGIATGYGNNRSDQMLASYFGLSRPLARHGVRSRNVPVERLLSDPVEILVIPEWLMVSARRDEPEGPMAEALDAVLAPGSPYTRGPSWQSSFFTSSLYTRLDPAFQADLWQGEIGLHVFVKKTLARRLRLGAHGKSTEITGDPFGGVE